MPTLLRSTVSPSGQACSSPVLDRLRTCPHVSLGCWPTPLQHLAGPGATGLWVKRDDLSGWGRGGAKARKLEHFIGHLQAYGHTEVVIVTGNVTNLVFDILPALDSFGIACRIFVVDYPAARPSERVATFSGVSERIELLGPQWGIALTRALAVWCRARLAGRRPFLLLPGAAHPSSVIGNACGLIELADQLGASALSSGALVFVTVATGTTLAGFLLGAHALAAAGGPIIRIVGVAVDRAPLATLTLWLIRWTERWLGLPMLVDAHEIEILSPERGLPFGGFTPDVEDACCRAQQNFSLRLDPIFGGKTWRAMELCLAADPSLRQRAVVYWHCGFTPEWRRISCRLGGTWGDA
jgi:1-aminocyclopropane-1-carboxylate deaminase